jgi:Flp pilus assembly pilin Flp
MLYLGFSSGDRRANPTTFESPYRREIAMIEKVQHKTLRMFSVLRVKLLDRGVPPVAYGLLVDLIAVVIVVGVAIVATQLQGVFPNASELFSQTGP